MHRFALILATSLACDPAAARDLSTTCADAWRCYDECIASDGIKLGHDAITGEPMDSCAACLLVPSDGYNETLELVAAADVDSVDVKIRTMAASRAACWHRL